MAVDLSSQTAETSSEYSNIQHAPKVHFEGGGDLELWEQHHERAIQDLRKQIVDKLRALSEVPKRKASKPSSWRRPSPQHPASRSAPQI